MRHPSKAALAAIAVASAIVLGAATAPVVGAAPGGAAAAAAKKAKLGMSAPADSWDKRVREVGSGLQARRIFLGSFTASLNMPAKACRAGMYPVISFKTGSYTWAQVVHGKADAKLRSMAKKLSALPCNVFVAVHHEPYGDGTPRSWSRMQAHALPLLGAHKGVKVGVIANGWWWSKGHHRLTKAQIAKWIPRSVISVSDVIAADTYQSSVKGEEASVKMKRMAGWAASRRRGQGTRDRGVQQPHGHRHHPRRPSAGLGAVVRLRLHLEHHRRDREGADRCAAHRVQEGPGRLVISA